MNAPQIILLALMGLGLVTNICLHGKPRPDHNGPVAFVVSALYAALLYWGGFFN